MKKLCCVVNLGIWKNRARRSTEGEASPVKDSKSDKIGRGSATESACTRAGAKRESSHWN